MTAQISDEYMNEQRARTRQYTLMLLKKTAGFDPEEVWPIVWEHGRRNFALRADGLVSIVLPMVDDSELAGCASSTSKPTKWAA